MFRVISGILAFVSFVLIVLLLVGYFSPEEYEGELSEFFTDRRAIVWQSLVNVENMPNVKTDIELLEILENNRGLLTWRENLLRGGFRTYRIVEKKEPFKYEINLFDSTEGVTGSWIFFLTQSSNGTTVKIIEDSKTTNVLLRGWHAILGRDVNLKYYMKVLRASLFRRLIDTP